MVAQVFLKNDFVDEAGVASPIVISERLGEGEVECEVAVSVGEVAEIFFVENFLP